MGAEKKSGPIPLISRSPHSLTKSSLYSLLESDMIVKVFLVFFCLLNKVSCDQNSLSQERNLASKSGRCIHYGTHHSLTSTLVRSRSSTHSCSHSFLAFFCF